MAGREVKDELNNEQAETVPPEDTRDQVFPIPIQIPTTPELEDTLVKIVLEDFESSKDSRNKRDYGVDSKGKERDFDSWMKELKDLYNAKRQAKTVPWRYCSNRSLRMATSILDMLHSRLFPAVVNEDLVRWRPGETKDFPKVERISKFMYWWVWVRSRLRTTFDNWVKVVLGFGDAITESMWRVEVTDSGEVEQVPAIDAFGNPTVRATKKYTMKESTYSKVYLKENYYLQEGSDNIKKDPVILEDTFFYRDLEQGEGEGKFVNISNGLRQRLPFKAPLGSALDPEQEERLKSIKLRNMPVKVLKWYGNYDADGDGFPEDIRILIAPEYEMYLGGIAVSNLTKTGERPLDFTKISSRIDRPFANDGEGILELVKELAEEIDAIFNQLTDGNTLSVLPPGFYDPTGAVDAPTLKLGPNKWTPVPNPQQNVYVLPINIPTEKLINAIRLVLEFVERLTAASSYVLGKESEIVGGSGTATRTQAIVQSAEIRFNLPAERLREGAARILNHHLDLVQLNIPPGLETRILGEDGKPLFKSDELTEEGISGEFDAYLLADPSMGSKQTERELAGMLYSILLQNVIVGTDPVKIYKVTADFLRAYGKDPEEYLGPAPDFDAIDKPEDENTLILQGDFERVRAQMPENHILHIQKHMEFLNSPALQQLAGHAPELAQQVVTFLNQHIIEHETMMKTMISLMQSFGKGGGGQNEGQLGEKRNGEASSGAGKPSRPETVPGPIGGALESQRKGQGGFTQNPQAG